MENQDSYINKSISEKDLIGDSIDESDIVKIQENMQAVHKQNASVETIKKQKVMSIAESAADSEELVQNLQSKSRPLQIKIEDLEL